MSVEDRYSAESESESGQRPRFHVPSEQHAALRATMVSRIQTQRRKKRSPLNTTTRKHFSVTAVVVDIVCQFGVSGIYSICPRQFITRLRSQKKKKFKLNRLHENSNTHLEYNVCDVSVKVLVESLLRELKDGGHLKDHTSKKRVRYKSLPQVKEITPLHLLGGPPSEWTSHVKRNRTAKTLRKYNDRPVLTDITPTSVLPTLVVTNSNSIYQSPHVWTRSETENENIPSSSGTELIDHEPVELLYNNVKNKQEFHTDHEGFSSDGSKLSLYENRIPEGCDDKRSPIDLPHKEDFYSFSPSQSSVRRRRNAQSVVSSISCYLDEITNMEFGSSDDLCSSYRDNDGCLADADDEGDILVSRTFSSRFYSVPAYTADRNFELEQDDKREYKRFDSEKPYSINNYPDKCVSLVSRSQSSSAETFCSDASLYVSNLPHHSSDRLTVVPRAIVKDPKDDAHTPEKLKPSYSTTQTGIECEGTSSGGKPSETTATVFNKEWNERLVSQIQDSADFANENENSPMSDLFSGPSDGQEKETLSGNNSEKSSTSLTSSSSPLSNYTDKVTQPHDMTDQTELQDSTSHLPNNKCKKEKGTEAHFPANLPPEESISKTYEIGVSDNILSEIHKSNGYFGDGAGNSTLVSLLSESDANITSKSEGSSDRKVCVDDSIERQNNCTQEQPRIVDPRVSDANKPGVFIPKENEVTKISKKLTVSMSPNAGDKINAKHSLVNDDCPLLSSIKPTTVDLDSKRPDGSQFETNANDINCTRKFDSDKLDPKFTQLKLAELGTKQNETASINNALEKDVDRNVINANSEAKCKLSGNGLIPAKGNSKESVNAQTFNNSVITNFTTGSYKCVNGLRSNGSAEVVDMGNLFKSTVCDTLSPAIVKADNDQTNSKSSLESAQQIAFRLSLKTEKTDSTEESKHKDSDQQIKSQQTRDLSIESDTTSHSSYERRHTIINTEIGISESAKVKHNMAAELRRKSWGGHTFPKISQEASSQKSPKLVTPTSPEIKASGFKLSLNDYSRTNSMEDGAVPIPEVKPGFFHLNIVVMSDRGRLHLNESISLLQSRCASEHEIVNNAIQNLICVFMCQDRSRRLEARKQLYNLSKSNPENLNTLANLEYIYRSSHRATDAKACRAKINDLMGKKGRKCDVLKAQCLLEQAYIYALLYNDHTGYEIVQERVKDINTRLDSLQRFCNSAESKLSVEIAHEHVQQMTRDVLNVEENIQCKSFEKDFCLKNYLGGMELLSSQPGTENEVMIWSYYQAVANYLLSDLGSESAKTNDTGPFRNKAAHLFLKVFKHLDPELRLYRARSLSYLGHLLSTAFEGKGDVFKDTLETFKITVTQQGGVPLFLFDKAKTFCNNEDDHVVLTTEARHYMGKALHKTNDTKEKKRSLDRADQAITKAIKALEDQQMNWYAYKHKRDINFSIYQLSLSQSETYLRQAKKAGEACILSGGVDDLVYLGMICNALATCQPNSRKMDTVADKEDVLYEGVDYLQQAIERGVQSKMKIQCYTSLANSLFQLKQHRHAIECLKRVIEEDLENNLELFKQLCVFFFQYYKQAGKDGVFILQELLFWIDWCGRKYGEDDVIGALAKHTKEYFNEILELLELIADKITRNGLSSNHSLLTKMKTKLEKIKQNESKKRLPKPPSKSLFATPRFGSKKPEKDSGGCVNNLIKSSIQLPVMIPQSYGSYDFYVFNSPVDGEWVMHVLRPALEESFGTDPLRGYLSGRDFVATDCGRIGPLKFAFARSLKIIILLSEDFIANEWFRYERKEQDAIKLLEEKASEGCIVPVLLDSKLEVDEEILKVTGETLIKPTDWETIRRCLVCI